MSTSASVPTVFELAAARTTLTRTGRREACGPCPFCGGTDRFRVNLESDRWACRHCHPQLADAIEFVRRRDGIGLRDACRALGIDPRELAARPSPRPRAADEEPREPSRAWRDAAEEMLARGRAAMSTWSGTTAWKHLEGRGFTRDTIRAFGFGFVSGRQGVFGLVADGPGILVPSRIAGELWGLKIRRLLPDGPRYKAITWADPGRAHREPAGVPHLFGTDGLAGREAAFLVEGELDALLLAQEAGDIAAFVTLGSCSADVRPRAAADLLRVPRRIIAYDADDAGRKGADRLCSAWPGLRFERAELPAGPWKDPGEFHLAGGNLRAWVRYTTRGTRP